MIVSDSRMVLDGHLLQSDGAAEVCWHIVVRVATVKVCRAGLTSSVAGRRDMGICFNNESASQEVWHIVVLIAAGKICSTRTHQ